MASVWWVRQDYGATFPEMSPCSLLPHVTRLPRQSYPGRIVLLFGGEGDRIFAFVTSLRRG